MSSMKLKSAQGSLAASQTSVIFVKANKEEPKIVNSN